MEFPFEIGPILKGDSSICVIHNTLESVNLDDLPAQNIKTCKEENHNNDARRSCCLNPITHSLFGSPSAENGCNGEKNDSDLLSIVINKVGEASAKAQSLHIPITTAHKLKISDHILYIMKDSESCDGKGCVVGILKVGRKKLFIVDEIGKFHEVNPLCILDFYVHESRQRMGCGKQLFEAFLKVENISPQELAIDRPSPKFLGFLKKHYNLEKTIPQTNRFVVFSGFFDKISSKTLEAPTRTNQRHSFAGVEYRCKNHNGRPHSLGGIEGCFSQNEKIAEDNSGSGPRDIRTSKKMSQESQKRNSSSWNVFGVPSHDYTQDQDKS